VCGTCHKLLTGLKPNPFTIPNVPKVEDIKTGLCMTRALDSAFMAANYFIAKQKAEEAGVEYYGTDDVATAIRHNLYPSFYNTSKNHLTITWESVAMINDIITRYTLSNDCDKSEATALKRLTKQVQDSIAEALTAMQRTRDEAISCAQRVSITTEPAVWNIVPVEDTSRNRGLLYVKAFDIAPQRGSEDEWSYKYRTDATDKGRGEFRQEIRAYVDVRDGAATVVFEQNAPTDGLTNWEDVIDNTLEEAVARATAVVQARCNYDDARDAQYAVYAQEALQAAGISTVAVEEVA
jgi:hypothetical protein